MRKSVAVVSAVVPLGLFSVLACLLPAGWAVAVEPGVGSPQGHARRRNALRKPGLKVHVVTLVCQVTGGPCKYVGKGMQESHSTFHISQKEWDAALVDFRASLDTFKVPAAEQRELVAIVESTKADTVVGSAATTK